VLFAGLCLVLSPSLSPFFFTVFLFVEDPFLFSPPHSESEDAFFFVALRFSPRKIKPFPLPTPTLSPFSHHLFLCGGVPPSWGPFLLLVFLPLHFRPFFRSKIRFYPPPYPHLLPPEMFPPGNVPLFERPPPTTVLMEGPFVALFPLFLPFFFIAMFAFFPCGTLVLPRSERFFVRPRLGKVGFPFRVSVPSRLVRSFSLDTLKFPGRTPYRNFLTPFPLFPEVSLPPSIKEPLFPTGTIPPHSVNFFNFFFASTWFPCQILIRLFVFFSEEASFLCKKFDVFSFGVVGPEALFCSLPLFFSFVIAPLSLKGLCLTGNCSMVFFFCGEHIFPGRVL